MNIWKLCLKLFGWKVDITVPKRDKCVICVAPHTSNFDFLLGLAAYRSIGREANFLMKDFWFFFPMGLIMRALGGIPVSRKKSTTSNENSLTHKVVQLFKARSYINLAVTPEGTRSATTKWHTGFLYIAYNADVPVQLGVIDYSRKIIQINKEYQPTSDVAIDMKNIKDYYSHYRNAAKYQDKFKL